jgi:hypothetical protein
MDARSALDFWLGEWDLTWPAEQTGGRAGELGRGTNRISQMFDGAVIAEEFAFADGSFRGHSVSVYDGTAGLWRQTWVDSDAGYLLFSGGPIADVVELRTEPGDGGRANRMVFRDITEDSLRWDWQKSPDGVSWSDLWNITYRRRPPPVL